MRYGLVLHPKIQNQLYRPDRYNIVISVDDSNLRLHAHNSSFSPWHGRFVKKRNLEYLRPDEPECSRLMMRIRINLYIREQLRRILYFIDQDRRLMRLEKQLRIILCKAAFIQIIQRNIFPIRSFFFRLIFIIITF